MLICKSVCGGITYCYLESCGKMGVTCYIIVIYPSYGGQQNPETTNGQEKDMALSKLAQKSLDHSAKGPKDTTTICMCIYLR